MVPCVVYYVQLKYNMILSYPVLCSSFRKPKSAIFSNFAPRTQWVNTDITRARLNVLLLKLPLYVR